MAEGMSKEDLKKLRLETGLSQDDFAVRLGFKPSRYKAWEYGHNGIDFLVEKHIRTIHKEILKEGK